MAWFLLVGPVPVLYMDLTGWLVGWLVEDSVSVFDCDGTSLNATYKLATERMCVMKFPCWINELLHHTEKEIKGATSKTNQATQATQHTNTSTILCLSLSLSLSVALFAVARSLVREDTNA
jgi:hypothetical protein